MLIDSITLKSTTVEIILYYLTTPGAKDQRKSTTVEIILYYLTVPEVTKPAYLQQ